MAKIAELQEVDVERCWGQGCWKYYGTYASVEEAKQDVESRGLSWSEFRVR